MDLKTLEKAGRKSADRREFLKKAGKVAATVPAVALLLSANATPAQAFGRYGKGGGGRPAGGSTSGSTGSSATRSSGGNFRLNTRHGYRYRVSRGGR